MTSINITAQQYTEYCSDKTLSLEDLAAISGMSRSDLETALSGGTLTISFDKGVGAIDTDDQTDLTIDLGNASVKYLTINDNGLDLAINENSSSTMYVFRNANAGTIESSDETYSAQLTINGAGGGSDYIYNATAFKLGSVDTDGSSSDSYYIKNFNIKSDVNVSGGAIAAASQMSIDGSQEITQSDEEGNIDGIIKVNINAMSNVATDLNYDVQLVDTINAGLDSLGELAAGLEVHINNSDTMKVVAGSRVSVKVNSTLGDTQSESFANQLRAWGEKNPIEKFTYGTGEYTAIQLADILDAGSASGATQAQKDAAEALRADLATGKVKLVGGGTGTVTYQAKEGSWKAGTPPQNGWGAWHGDFTFTTKLSGQNQPPNFASTTQNGGGNFFLAPEAVEALNNLGKHKWSIDTDGTVMIDGKAILDGYSFTDEEKAIIGGTYTEQTITSDNTLHLVDGDSFSLHLGADTLTDGGTIGDETCRFCDPVAMIYIDDIGNSSGSLFAETINTAKILSLGTRELDGDEFVLSGAAARGIQFQTGIKVAHSDQADAITGNVTQDIQLDGTQDRSGAKIIGILVNEAGKKTTTSISNIGAIGNSQTGTLEDTQTMDGLNELLQRKGCSLSDVDTWLMDAEIVSYLVTNKIPLPDSAANKLIKKLVIDGTLRGTGAGQLSDDQIAQLLSAQLTMTHSDPLLVAWLTEQVTDSDTSTDSLILAFLNNSTTCAKMSDIILQNLDDSDAETFVLSHWEASDAVYNIIVSDVAMGDGSKLIDGLMAGLGAASNPTDDLMLELLEESSLDDVDGGNPLFNRLAAALSFNDAVDAFVLGHLSGAGKSEGLQVMMIQHIADGNVSTFVADKIRDEATYHLGAGPMISFVLDVTTNRADWLGTGGSRIGSTEAARLEALQGLTALVFSVFSTLMTDAAEAGALGTGVCRENLQGKVLDETLDVFVRNAAAGALNMIDLMNTILASGLAKWEIKYT